jgi:hypothetical protein
MGKKFGKMIHLPLVGREKEWGQNLWGFGGKFGLKRLHESGGKEKQMERRKGGGITVFGCGVYLLNLYLPSGIPEILPTNYNYAMGN